MKYLLLLAVFFATKINAQSILNFDKRFVQSEDKWVAFPPDKDSSLHFGFIYIDEQAGLTLNYEGTFRILSSGQFVPQKLDSTSMKVRLNPNNVLVAFIPESKFEELKIQAVPKWLAAYKSDSNSVARLYKWGFTYNGWDECAKALPYLQKAEKIDPTYSGLSVELAFSYNCLGQYENAISVLQYALKTTPTDAYTNKELIYAQIKSGQLDKAAESCKRALKVCTDTTYNGENCYNLLHNLFEKKDRKNFNLWLAETKKWCAGKDQFMKGVVAMENEVNSSN